MKASDNVGVDGYGELLGTAVVFGVLGSFAAIVCITTVAAILLSVRGGREETPESSRW